MEISPPAEDGLLPFQLEVSSLRGRIVRLGPVLDVILGQHDYPPAIGRLLAGAVTLATVLASSLKYEGVFTLQTKSDGPAHLLVADVTSAGLIRACANFRGADLAKAVSLIGKGHLAFTVDQKGARDRYQGIVALEGDDLAVAVQTYFRQSEQIPTGIILAVNQDAAGHWHAGSLMLQRMPREGGKEERPSDTAFEDDWHRAMMLMQTATEEELTDPALSLEAFLFRLFHEEGVRVFEAKTYTHGCRCSRGRVEGMLRSLPFEEVKNLAIDGTVEVKCEFCGKTYYVSLAELAAMAAEDANNSETASLPETA